MYPECLAGYNLAWIESLAALRDQATQIKLERKEVQGILTNPELVTFYQTIENLCQTPSIPKLDPLPETPFTYSFMIPKKQHEIKRLAPFVQHFYKSNKLQTIIDIGGGIGLLAQTLSNAYALPVQSLDMDPQLQETGRKRHEKNATHPEQKVRYRQLKVAATDSEFLRLLSPTVLTLGLHACGSLSVDQLRASVLKQSGGIINFGCCYHKMSQSPEDQNISDFARTMPNKVQLSPFALTLASRAHRKMDEKDFFFKGKVKRYRYTLHILLHEKYGQKELISFGNSNPKLYDESFSNYVRVQFQRAGLELKQSDAELEAFYQNHDLQEYVWRMQMAGLIRNALGRLLEMYLLLDRAIFLEETGYKVQLLEFFDEPVSPRNLGIVALSNFSTPLNNF